MFATSTSTWLHAAINHGGFDFKRIKRNDRKVRSEKMEKKNDIDIEISFCVEYCTTCNISPVGLLLRQTRIKKNKIF